MRPLLLIVAVCVGVAITWSPLTVATAVLLAAIAAWAVHGTAPGERRWILGLLGVAVAVRVALVIALFLTADAERHQVNTLFPDGMPTIARSWWIRNLWLGVPIGPFYKVAVYDPYGASSYFYLLAFVQTIFGPAPYALVLFNAAIYMAGAVALFRLARASYGSVAALVGLAVVLLMPTLLAWSTSVLKDPMHFGFAALTLYCVFQAVRAERHATRAWWMAGVAAGLMLLSGFRSGALIITVAGLGAGFVLRAALWRFSSAALTAATVAVILAIAWNVPALQARAWDQLQLAANRHLGHARTEGASYRVLDQRFYSEGFESVFTMTGPEGARFVIRSLASLVLVPLPWEASTRTTVALIPQQVVWYALVLLGIAGLPAAFRRAPLLTCLLIGYAVVAAGVISLNSGNVGTLLRYRDMVVPFAIWLSGCGVATVTAWCTAPAVTWTSAEAVG